MSSCVTCLPLATLAAFALATPAMAHSDHTGFADPDFVEAPHIVDRTLENGDAAQCQAFTVAYQPEGLQIGPFCPPTLDDTGGPGADLAEVAKALDPDEAALRAALPVTRPFLDR